MLLRVLNFTLNFAPLSFPQRHTHTAVSGQVNGMRISFPLETPQELISVDIVTSCSWQASDSAMSHEQKPDKPGEGGSSSSGPLRMGSVWRKLGLYLGSS